MARLTKAEIRQFNNLIGYMHEMIRAKFHCDQEGYEIAIGKIREEVKEEEEEPQT